MLSVPQIAQLCHELNRAYCALLGDTSQVPWDEAPDWQRSSAIAGVEHALAGTRTPEQSHESWLAQKSAEGWTYGPVKDVEKKQHPCFVPYAELPDDQKLKNALFLGVVNAVTGGPFSRQRAAAAAVVPALTRVQIAGLPFRLVDDAVVEGTQAHVNEALEEQATGDAARTGVDSGGTSGAADGLPRHGDALEKFLRPRVGHKLTLTVHPVPAGEPDHAPIRIASIDQSSAIEGAVIGNVFFPKG